MPTLPRYDQTLAPVTNRRIIEKPRLPADDGVGKGLSQAAQAIEEIQLRLNTERDEKQVAEADRRLRERMDRVKFDLEHTETDLPDAAIPVRWKEESEAIIAEAGASISSGRYREVWTQKARELQADGDIWSRTLGVKRGADRTRAETIATVADIGATAGDAAIAPETFQRSVEEQRAAVRRQVDRGFMDQSTAAQINAQLDDVQRKDGLLRAQDAIEAKVRAGDMAGANEIISGFTTREDKRNLQNLRDSVQGDVDRAAAQAEAAIRAQQRANGNKFEMGVLEGRLGYKDLDRAVMSGDIHPDDKPALYRTIRAEQDRQLTSTRLSAIEQQMLKDRSADSRLALSTMPDAQFMAGPQAWTGPARDIYDAMTPDDRRAVTAEWLKRSEEGRGAPAVKSMYGALASAAKRYVPAEWKLSSETAMGDGDGLVFSGILYEHATALSAERGGKPLTPAEIREVVVRSLRQFDTKAEVGTFAADITLRDLARKALAAQLKRDPEPDEIDAVIARASGGGQ